MFTGARADARGDGGTPARQPEGVATVWDESEILAEAVAIAHVGAWTWDISSGQLQWTDEVYRIFGLTPKEFPATYESFFDYVHPDDRERIQAAIDNAVGLAAPYAIGHRVVRPSGEIRYVEERGHITVGPDGKAERMLGVIQDVTDAETLRQELEESGRN